jgi:hypothetical protein
MTFYQTLESTRSTFIALSVAAKVKTRWSTLGNVNIGRMIELRTES